MSDRGGGKLLSWLVGYGRAVVEAVLFDMGGVIVSGPWEGFAAYERANGLPEGLIRRINSIDPDSNAWAQMERGRSGWRSLLWRSRRRPRRWGIGLTGRWC